MLTVLEGRRIWLARAVVDMRKSFDTLAALVKNQLDRDPYAGDVFVFLGKTRSRVKILVWDISGFWLCAKRLEKGTFALPHPLQNPDSRSVVILSSAEMHMLLEGINVHHATYHAHYHRRDDVVARAASSAQI